MLLLELWINPRQRQRHQQIFQLIVYDFLALKNQTFVFFCGRQVGLVDAHGQELFYFLEVGLVDAVE